MVALLEFPTANVIQCCILDNYELKSIIKFLLEDLVRTLKRKLNSFSFEPQKIKILNKHLPQELI